ncbi:uncharacterized protein LOC119671165 [Teleopsis dalmanni]|uniref:uncharacterized protein LOC119671165 n=1 Tax=Teleopsis dalmanni TaxID=139649 RepID=UPI0018CED97E|nr:uncharacterized protein LOC119671165 [Teleopsis dalmanni]
MKSFMCLTLLGLVLFVAYANAGCDDNSKESDEGDVKSWFKNLGCSIKKGAEDLGEQAKPIASKISETAKDFGNTVAQKYDELKHKLTDDTAQAASSSTPINLGAPTEKVPLAPLHGEVPIPTPTA